MKFTFGKAVNKPNKRANSVLSFMLIRLSGGPKFICRVLPVKELDALFLFEQTDVIISGVKQVVGELVAIICDGNRVNQSFFRKFDTHIENSWCTEDDMFLLFDYVHLLKDLHNKWIVEKTIIKVILLI